MLIETQLSGWNSFVVICHLDFYFTIKDHHGSLVIREQVSIMKIINIIHGVYRECIDENLLELGAILMLRIGFPGRQMRQAHNPIIDYSLICR